MQFEEIGNVSGKTLMLLLGTCCDWQTNFGAVAVRRERIRRTCAESYR